MILRGVVNTDRRFTVVLVLLVMLAYGQTVNYPFVYDDLSGIVTDSTISHTETVTQAAHVLRQPLRALTGFTYALTHALLGFNRIAFHTTNVIIHIVNTLLIFAIGIRLARRWLPNVNPAHFAFVAAAIQAVHPLYTEAVTYVSGRSSSLCALFYFSCLLCILCGEESQSATRRRLWFCAAAGSGILAWAAKEEAITLPLMAAIFLMLVGRIRPAIAFMAIPAVVLVARGQAIARLYESAAANRALVEIGVGAPVQVSSYVLSEIKAAVFYYMSHFAVPLRQSVDPEFRAVQSIFEPGFLLALATLAAIVVVAARYSAKQPVVTFSIAALLVSPLLAYAALPLPDLVAEHRIYISGLGFDLLVAWILTRARKLMWPSAVALMIVFVSITVARNSVWASEIRLWEQAAANSQAKVRPHLNLGAAYQVAGQYDPALIEYRRVLLIRRDVPLVYSNVGAIYLEMGRLDDAETMLKRAIELAPSMPRPYINLAAIAVSRNKPREAFDYAARAERAGAEAYWVHFLRAEAFALSNEMESARVEYEVALPLIQGNRPLQDEIRNRLAAIRAQSK
jgi:tetratricopeptide (TPR) repeat protein